MKTSLFLAAQLLFAAVLMWTCFCRLVKTDDGTHREIRWAFVFEGVAAGMVFGAPFLPILMPREAHWPAYSTPAWVWMALLCAAAMVQVATARLWLDGSAQRAYRSFPARPAAAFAMVLLLAGSVAAPRLAFAQPELQPGETPIMGHAHYMATGDRVRCMHSSGCVLMTPEALKGLLRTANGHCGQNPLLPGARAS